MLAIGGTVGTGLFVGVKNCLVQGPFVAIIAYLYVASVCYGVLRAVSDMTRALCAHVSLCSFPTLYLSPEIGAANAGIYWFSWAMTLALELTILAQVLLFWFPWAHTYPQVVSFVIWAALTALNLLPVAFYAEVEFYLTLVKVVALVVWSLICIAAIAGIGCETIGFQNWTQPWGDGILVTSPFWSRVLALVASLVSAAFTFQLSESVAITASDMSDPQTAVPRAVRAVYVRIVLFYILSVVLLTLLVSANDPRLLLDTSADPTDTETFLSSPFVLALLNAGWPSNSALLHILNLVIFFSILSAANSNIYFGSRCFLSLEHVPLFLKARNTAGVPVAAVAITASFGLFSLATGFHSIDLVFLWLLNVCACAGLLMWCCSAFSHLRFAAKVGCKSGKNVQLAPLWSLYAAINTLLILLANGIVVFFDFSWLSLLASYLSVLLFGVLWALQRPKSFLIPLETPE